MYCVNALFCILLKSKQFVLYGIVIDFDSRPTMQSTGMYLSDYYSCRTTLQSHFYFTETASATPFLETYLELVVAVGSSVVVLVLSFIIIITISLICIKYEKLCETY